MHLQVLILFLLSSFLLSTSAYNVYRGVFPRDVSYYSPEISVRIGNQMPPHNEPDAILINVGGNQPRGQPGFGVPGGQGPFGPPGGPGSFGPPRGPGQFGPSGGPGVFGQPSGPGVFEHPSGPGNAGRPGIFGQPGGPNEYPGNFRPFGNPNVFRKPNHPGTFGPSGNPGIFVQSGNPGVFSVPSNPNMFGHPGNNGILGQPGHPGSMGHPGVPEFFGQPEVFGIPNGNEVFVAVGPGTPNMFPDGQNGFGGNPGLTQPRFFVPNYEGAGRVFPEAFMPGNTRGAGGPRFIPQGGMVPPEIETVPGKIDPKQKGHEGRREVYEDPIAGIFPLIDRSN